MKPSRGKTVYRLSGIQSIGCLGYHYLIIFQSDVDKAGTFILAKVTRHAFSRKRFCFYATREYNELIPYQMKEEVNAKTVFPVHALEISN